MMYPCRSEMDLEGPILGCNRLQIYGLFALSCRDLQNYLVDVAMSSENGVSGVQCGPPQGSSRRSGLQDTATAERAGP